MNTSAEDIDRRENWIRLRLTDGLTRSRFFQLLQLFESPERIIGAGVDTLCRQANIPQPLAEAIVKGPPPETVQKELETIHSLNVRVLTCRDASYPLNLLYSTEPPPLLYTIGDFKDTDRYSISVVGTRRFSQYGRLACERICGRLAEAGLAIVSGLARGIDSIAHQTALRYQGRTLAVLGNGLARCYPSENQGLLEAVAENGVAMSEYPMHTGPERYNFPERNRIIAALSLATIIVEAGERSGSLITADHALEENREVFAVPGDITRIASAGTNRLIQRGARLIASGDDVLEDMRFLLGDLLQKEKRKERESVVADLNETEQRLYQAIAAEPIHIDSLLQMYPADEMDISKLSALLFQLEMKGLVRQLPGQIYATV